MLIDIQGRTYALLRNAGRKSPEPVDDHCDDPAAILGRCHPRKLDDVLVKEFADDDGRR